MLSREENELLTRGGPARRWARCFAATGCLPCSAKSYPSRTATRCACACWARTSSPSATARAAWGCSPSIARTAAPRWPTGATRTAGCAASTTAGSSTSRAMCGDAARTARQHLQGPHPPRAYPTREAGGAIWLPRRARAGAAVSRPGGAGRPANGRSVVKVFEDCSYAQGMEGSIDSAHSDYLHSSTILGRPRDHAPRLEGKDTPYGFHYAAIRRPDVDADTHQYVRVTLFVAPCSVLIPPLRSPGLGSDSAANLGADRRRAHLLLRLRPQPGRSAAAHASRRLSGAVALRCGLRPARTRQNLHLQDRAAMRTDSWSGVDGVRSQDHAVAESMGPIADRTREHLGASDVAVIRMRRCLLDAARALAAGVDPPVSRPPYPGVRSTPRRGLSRATRHGRPSSTVAPRRPVPRWARAGAAATLRGRPNRQVAGSRPGRRGCTGARRRSRSRGYDAVAGAVLRRAGATTRPPAQ